MQIHKIHKSGIRSWGGEDLLKKEMTTHSSILAWGISWAEEPGKLHVLHGLEESDRTE